MGITTNPNATATSNSSCSFDTSSSTLTCVGSQSNSTSTCTIDFTTRTRYESTADFADEFMGRTLAIGAVSEASPISTSGPGSSPPGETTHTYDSQRRLVRTVVVNPTGAGSPAVTSTYTAWDARDRPTVGSVTIPGAPSTSLAIEYDDAARTIRATAASSGSTYVTTQFYDADGILLRETGQPVGFITNDLTETVWTIQDRQQVCR